MATTATTTPVQDFLVWLGQHEKGFLIALLAVVGAVWGFVELADAVTDGETESLDESLLLSLRVPSDITDPLGPRWLEEMARDITGLGGVGILTFLTFASAGFLTLQGKSHTALYLLSAIGTGIALSLALKAGFDRPRPDLVPHASYVYTSSFPSGHSMMSAVTYLTLGAVVAGAQDSRRLKAFFIGLAAFLSLCIGVTRVYLGVHWPTDILGGWTAGAAWALLCWALASRLRQRGTVE